MLSEELKKFSEIAHIKRAEFIKAVLIDKSSLGIWHPIPITRDEADFQQSETSLTKIEILTIINSLISSLNDLDQLCFQSLSSKSFVKKLKTNIFYYLLYTCISFLVLNKFF